jgi:DNA-binding NarL/FixJ family response regulator
VSLGDLASAKKAADALAKASRGHQHPQTAALASRAAGLLAAAARSPDQAVRSLRVAVEEFEGRELPFEAARTRLDLAHALVAVEPTMAVVEARRAGDALTALGAEHEADRAAALLRDLGVATRTGPRDAGVLTLREREVLALVQRGLTNPQIAARLYISRRTVGHHVSSILAKLGLSTRAEAAAFAATLELAERPSPGPGAGPCRGGS